MEARELYKEQRVLQHGAETKVELVGQEPEKKGKEARLEWKSWAQLGRTDHPVVVCQIRAFSDRLCNWLAEQ